MRPERNQPVEARGKALQALTGQTGNQIRVDVNGCLGPQEAKIVFEPLVILAAMNQLSDLRIKSLDPHLELKGAGWEPHNDLAQRLRQPVGHHLEVKEEPGPVPFEQELQDGPASIDVQIECPIHELELLHTPVEQMLQVTEQRGQRRLAHRDVQRRKAELAREGAAARSLNINDTVRYVPVVIKIIGQHQLGKFGQPGGNDLRGWAFTAEQLSADFGKLQIRLPGNDVIGHLHDGLNLGIVTDFRPSQN